MSNDFFKRTKHDESHVRQIFGRDSDARLASQLHKENKPLYDSMRKDAEVIGLIGPVREHMWAPAHRQQLAKLEAEQGKGLTAEQANACKEFSREEVYRLQHKDANDSGESLSDVSKDPARHAAYKLARDAYGMGNNTNVSVVDHRPKYEPKPKPPVDNRMQLSDSVCDEVGIPRGTKAANWDEFSKITIESAERKLGRIKAAQGVPAQQSDAPAAPPVTEEQN
jgi:hypothetical protein